MPDRSGAAKKKGAKELVVITGLSGSGKGTVLRCLEDLGYYAVDHLPIGLIGKFAELVQASGAIARAAIVVDVREGEALKDFPKLFAGIRRLMRTRLVFLTAGEDTLIRRYSETRRPHPLSRDESVVKALRAERAKMEPIRKLADHVIDSSKFTVHELREVIGETFGSGRDASSIVVYVTSFGFRHGLPGDSDLVFDVRFLPNPNYLPEFKNRTGRDPRVARYIRSFQQTVEFIERISALLTYLLPHYIEEGKSYLTISFGCTGGQHRSVMIADEIRKRLTRAGYLVKCTHRDIAKRAGG